MLKYMDSPTLKIVGGGLRFVVDSERQWIINIVEIPDRHEEHT
jgi:hypothetical protein